MDCKTLFENITSYIDEELPLEERKSLEEHLSACSQCRELYSSLNETVSLVRSLPRVPAPSGFTAQVREKIRNSKTAGREEKTVKKGSRHLFLHRWVPLAAAAVIVFVLGGSFILLKEKPATENREMTSAPSSEMLGKEIARADKGKLAGTSGLKRLGEKGARLSPDVAAKRLEALGYVTENEETPALKEGYLGKKLEPERGGIEFKLSEELQQQRDEVSAESLQREGFALLESKGKRGQGRTIPPVVITVTSTNPGSRDLEEVVRILRDYDVEPQLKKEGKEGKEDYRRSFKNKVMDGPAIDSFEGMEFEKQAKIEMLITTQQLRNIERELKNFDKGDPHLTVEIPVKKGMRPPVASKALIEKEKLARGVPARTPAADKKPQSEGASRERKSAFREEKDQKAGEARKKIQGDSRTSLGIGAGLKKKEKKIKVFIIFKKQ